MPKGMLLRSHSWATNLSDPSGQYRFARFLEGSRYHGRYPIPREAFIEYGLWLQEHAVPNVDQAYVASVERRNNRDFLLTLDDGRQVQSAAVVMAIGLACHANRPREYRGLAAGLVSHS